MMKLLLLIMMFVLPAPAFAQSCQIPDRLPPPQPNRISPADVRKMPTTDYALAISWSPQFCRTRAASDPVQCAKGNRFGFVLHGLWPEGEGRSWPQYCQPVGALPDALVRRNFCATPSVRLQQHEWEKHGSCVTGDPAAYFTAATTLFIALRWPDMNALSRARPDVAGLTRAIVGANRGLRSDAIRVDLNRGGWLEEVRICLNKDFRPMACPRDTPGARPRDRVKIWRLE